MPGQVQEGGLCKAQGLGTGNRRLAFEGDVGWGRLGGRTLPPGPFPTSAVSGGSLTSEACSEPGSGKVCTETHTPPPTHTPSWRNLRQHHQELAFQGEGGEGKGRYKL